MNTEKNNEPQELKCPFCGKTPVYGVFVTSYYFRKEHKLYNSSENLIIPESENDNISDVIGYPIEDQHFALFAKYCFHLKPERDSYSDAAIACCVPG